MNATNDSTTIRTYFFNKTNKQCGQPKTERVSKSYLKASLFNTYADHWQNAIDNLKEIASGAGSIIKIELFESLTFPNFLDFTIYFDERQSAASLLKHFQAVNSLHHHPTFMNIEIHEVEDMNN